VAGGERPAPGQFEVVAADIGQGTAVLVRTRHHLLLYDAGPAWGPESDAGERVLLPLLRARGERRIDLLVLSHRDIDHVGGAASLLARLPVGRMISSLEPAHPLRAAAVPQQRCEAGPPGPGTACTSRCCTPAGDHALALKPNAVSCVLRVQGAQGAGGSSLLLTGDIEANQEAALLERQRTRLPSAVLLVPHHGSRTSSTAGFVDAVAPRVALVQAAYRSRFGHPAPAVVARYRERGTLVVRSDAAAPGR
jgi:competence protein ComEC